MKRIGVITMHSVRNFGSFLQTYATIQMIKGLGHNPFVVNYIPTNRTLKANILRVSALRWKKNVFTRAFYRLCYLPENLINWHIFGKCINREFPLTEVFHTNEEMAGKVKADAFLTGSDKVWSFSCNNGYDPAYFLEFVKDTARISYSSSICETKLSQDEMHCIHPALKKYSAISVREYESVEILRKMGLPSITTLDPVLMLTKTEWTEFAKKSKLKLPKQPYLLIYMFGRETEPIRMAKEAASKAGLHVVRIGWDFSNRKYCNDVRAFINPYDFVKLFLNCERVVTNSFHGTAFSIAFNKDFTVTRDIMDPRFSTLLKTFHLEPRFFDSKYSLETVSHITDSIDFISVNEILNCERNKSFDFLRNAIGNNYNAGDKICRNCYGCTACTAVCPKKCIALELNSSGFFEAHINLDDCIHCDACRKVCPQNSLPSNNTERLETPQYYVAESGDKMVLSFAASGGAAYELSRSAILKGWKVIGTIYNLDTDRAEWRIASTIEDLWRFCGSKYIQSLPLDVVSQINPANKYLIIATPCQISGLLKLIERKCWNRDNFVLVDFHCHGVPSYAIWDNYINMVKGKMKVDKFTNIQFRSKVKGWHTFVMRFDSEAKVYYSTGDRNLFYDYFFSHTWFNHCCTECTLKQDKSYADLRIGDCWNPAFRKYKPGKSSISVFTLRGLTWLNSCEYLISKQYNHDFVLSGQIAKGVSQGKYAKVIQTKLSLGRPLRFLRFKYIFLPSLAPRIKDKLQTLFRSVMQ